MYPEINPFKTHQLERDGHRIYVEEVGNPFGIPVVFLHGGPGAGCRPQHRRFFDPQRFRVVLIDQRGAGRSTPTGLLKNNTTPHLLSDLVDIRIQLGIERWIVFGGSWGATLGLLYAAQEPDRVLGLILRGSFLARQRDLDWYAGPEGVRRIYPDAWARFLALLGEANPVGIEEIHRLLLDHDQAIHRRVAAAWEYWGSCVVLGAPFPECVPPPDLSPIKVGQAMIELHYAYHRYFIDEGAVLEGIPVSPNYPVTLIHGRKDLVCPLEAATTLKALIPHARLRILEDAGHIAEGASMIDALINAVNEMADQMENCVWQNA